MRAVMPGSRRARSQRGWLRDVRSDPEVQTWRADRARNWDAICAVLAFHADWTSQCTRPTWDRIACQAGREHGHDPDTGACQPDPQTNRPLRLHRATVARCVAWLVARGYLGVVESGSTPFLRPGVLHGLPDVAEGNRAGVYVLTTRGRPTQKRRIRPAHGPGSSQNATPSQSPLGDCEGPSRAGARITEHGAKIKGDTALASLGQSMLPRPGRSPLAAAPKTRSEALEAALAVQERARALRALSAEHVRHLTRPFFTAGFSAQDVLFALDHGPSGRRYGFTGGVRWPAGWARARLTAWLAPDGTPRPSASQVRAAAAAAVRADQEARRAAQAAVAARAVDAVASGHGQRARAALAAASTQAAAAIAQGAAGRRARTRPGPAAGPAVTAAGNPPRSTPRAPLRPGPAPAAPPNRPAPELPAWWTDAVAAAARAAAEQEAAEQAARDGTAAGKPGVS